MTVKEGNGGTWMEEGEGGREGGECSPGLKLWSGDPTPTPPPKGESEGIQRATCSLTYNLIKLWIYLFGKTLPR